MVGDATIRSKPILLERAALSDLQLIEDDCRRRAESVTRTRWWASYNSFFRQDPDVVVFGNGTGLGFAQEFRSRKERLKSLSRSRRIRHKTQVRLRRKAERLPWLCLEWDGIFTSQRLSDWKAPLATARALHGADARLR